MAEELLSTETSGGGDDWDKYKVKATDPSKEDWSKYAVKKKANTVALPSGVDLSGNGFTPSPSSQQESQLTPVLPSAEQEVAQRQQQDAMQQQQKATAFSNRLKEVYESAEPALKKEIGKIQGLPLKKETASATPQDEIDHMNFMNSTLGRVVTPLAYIGSKASHGGLQIAKGVAHLASLSQNPASLGLPEPTDGAFAKADKAANLGLSEGDISNIENGASKGSKALSALGMVAEFAPAIAGGEAASGTKLPAALMYLQGVGAGKDAADRIEGLNPLAKEALIQGSGVVNLALTDLGSNLFGKGVSAAVKDKVVAGIAADAIKESAGKQITADTFESLLKNKAASFAEKFERAPMETLKHYTDAAKTFAKLDVGNFAVHKAVDKIQEANGDQPVFNENAGMLAENLNKSMTEAVPMFGTLGALGAASKLLPNSSYENDVVKSVMNDPSPENVDAIKQQIHDHGFGDNQDVKWTPEEMDATFKHVDNIAQAAKSIPATLPENKRSKAIGLVVDRNALQEELKSAQESKIALDPSIKDLPTAKEEYLTNKIEQANDKLRDIVTGNRTTYSKGVEDKEQDKFFKTTDGAKEEITPSRYDLERTEREAKIQNEQAKPNTQVPAEQPADEAVGVPKVADQNDATVGYSEALSKEQTLKEEPNNATKTGNVEENNQQEHKNGEKIREAEKASNSNSAKQSGEKQQEKVADPAHQKAIDAITHGIIGNGERKAGDVSPRFDLGMDTRDQKKAISDITKGNYDTAPAKKMIDKVSEFEAKGEYPIIEGDGGSSVRSRFATSDEIQQHIDEAKSFKAQKLSDERATEFNKYAQPEHGLTDEDFDNYEKYRTDPTGERASLERDAQNASGEVQRPEDDQAASPTQDTGGKAVPGSLSEQEANRLKELRKKFSGQFNDITRIPTMLADKEFREYAGLVFKDTLGDFKAFSKRMVDEVGEKIKEHLPQLFKDLGGEPPKEVVPEESGLNKASVSENRKVIGLKDVNKPEVLDGDQEYRKAAEKVRNGSLSPYDIAEKIIHTRATPTIEEFNALLYQNRVIDNDYESAISKVEEAEKSGNAADKEDARNQLIVLERNKDLLHNAARNVSYNWGFMGRVLQEAVKKDYTLSNLRSLFRSKADGEIPADIEAKLTQYVKERDEAVKNLQDYQSKEAERAAQVKVDRERRANNRKVTTEKLDKAIEDTFASISKKLKAQRATLSMNPIPIEMLPDIGKLVSYYTQKGVIKATDIADNIFSRLKDDIDGLTKKDVIDAMAGNGYQKETKPLDELQRQRADVKLQAKLIARLEELESGNVKPSLLKSKRSISDEVQSLRERIKKAAIDAGLPLDNLKKNLQAKLDELEKTIQGIQSGEIEAPKKAPAYKVESDQEALRLKAKVKRAEKLIDELGANLDQRREKNVNKFLDGYTKLHRFFILSRIGTLAKLRAAAMGRQLTTPVEEALGSINRIMPGFRKIAERSPRFSKGFKISAEVKAVSEYYSKSTIKDNNQVLKEGHGELDYLFDPKAQKETEMAGFPGRLHAWLKNSTKRAEWQRSFEHIMQWEKNNDPTLDVNDPAVQERVGKEAYKESRRSIFMNDNMSVDLYNNVLQFAERNWGVTGKAVATAFRALMPIVKIPTNFALEAADYSTLGARAIPTILKAVFKGAESLSPKEADFVMRMMRKGQLGGAMMAISYFNPKHFGGYNIPGQKRDKNDLHQGDMVIGDFHVPHLLQHIPLISAMQAAATLRRTRDLNIEKGKEGGTYKGVINGFMGIMENVPFLSAPSELEDALKSDNAFNSYVGSMVKNQVEPGLIQEVAEQTDTKDGSFATINPENAQKRYPDTKDGLGKAITDNLKMGIPGLREQVSGLKASEVDKAVKKIKLPNGPEFELNDAQVKDRQNVNADFIQKNGGRLKAALERKAAADKELLKKIHDRAKVWAENEVPIEEKKKFKQELIDAYVEHHIKLIANKHSMPYIYRKYKKDLKPIDE